MTSATCPKSQYITFLIYSTYPSICSCCRLALLPACTSDDLGVDIDVDVNMESYDSVISSVRRNNRLNPGFEYLSRASRSEKMSGRQRRETDNIEGFSETVRNGVEHMRFSSSAMNYPDEGLLSYNVESLGNRQDRDRAYRLQYLEHNRAKLLRELDELKEQLSRSRSVNEIPFRGRMDFPDPYVSDGRLTGHSSTYTRTKAQLFSPDRQAGMTMYNLPRYGNHVGPQMLRRTLPRMPGRYQDLPPQYLSEHYVDTVLEPYPSKAAASYGNKVFDDASKEPAVYYPDKTRAFDPLLQASRMTDPSPSSLHGPQSYARRDLNSELNSFTRQRPCGEVLASGTKCCRPIAGGAPFLTCLNCFKTLQLTAKSTLKAKFRRKMKCGACSTVINLSFENKKLVLSLNSVSAQVPEVVDDSSNWTMKEDSNTNHNHTTPTILSDDYGNSGYNFQDRVAIALSRDQDINSNTPEDAHNFNSRSPSTSSEDVSPEVINETIDVIDSPSNNHVINQFTKLNFNSDSGQEIVTENGSAGRENAVEEASLATVTELSRDSWDASREDKSFRIHKGDESSLKDFSLFNQTNDLGQRNVFVNGHPVTDREVKKAERLAGPIDPGHFWYDFRAGFWGVLGGPCLGIIPSFIEEFNYKMPEDCSGGNTDVYVNGRELHGHDLDLLARKGLPTDRNRAYIIEFSGRVFDQDTGEELNSLGKLAPTVEKMKCGFGMKGTKFSNQI